MPNSNQPKGKTIMNVIMNPAASIPVGSLSRTPGASVARDGATKSWTQTVPNASAVPKKAIRKPTNPKRPRLPTGDVETNQPGQEQHRAEQEQQPDEDVRRRGRPFAQVLGFGGEGQQISDQKQHAGRHGRQTAQANEVRRRHSVPPCSKYLY